jgi:hypothetical protein
VSGYPAIPGPDPAADPDLARLLDTLRQRHRGAICGILLYGSCLRSGDLYDGLLDLYLVCDSYRAAYGKGLPAVANWLLPPNVIYAELESGGRVMRSKVAVISLSDFRCGCSPDRFESYIWGRFAQPTRILYSRDEGVRRELEECLLRASSTLLQAAAPSLPGEGSVESLWRQALGLSYATELRTERAGRTAELVRFSGEFYDALTRLHAASPGFPLVVYEQAEGLHYRSDIGRWTRLRARWAWFWRRVQGKCLSVMRLVKALFTFDGGLDYIAWKLSRHSGEEIVIPDRVRRAPLIFAWGFFWQLYRRGIFR